MLIEKAHLEKEDPKTATNFSIDGDISTCTNQLVSRQTVWEGLLPTVENISAVQIVLEGKNSLMIFFSALSFTELVNTVLLLKVNEK